MDLNHLPIIDWEQAIKLAGNKKIFAEEMLMLLIKDLSNEITMLKKLNNEKKYNELLRKVHKLHGALCYCGLPRLKKIISGLENTLKNKIMLDLSSLLDQLDIEASLLLNHYPNQYTSTAVLDKHI